MHNSVVQVEVRNEGEQLSTKSAGVIHRINTMLSLGRSVSIRTQASRIPGLPLFLHSIISDIGIYDAMHSKMTDEVERVAIVSRAWIVVDTGPQSVSGQ